MQSRPRCLLVGKYRPCMFVATIRSQPWLTGDIVLEIGGPIVLRWLVTESLTADHAARWTAVLDPAERAAAERFHFPADRRQYLAAHALTRGLIAAATSQPAATLLFTRRPGGKPELATPPGVEFSLSHTRSLVAVAVGRGLALGVDVEPIDRVAAVTDIAARYFAPAEAALVRGEGRRAFLRLWTLKEAYLKATGEGLARPLRSFAFTLDPLRVDDGITGRCWRFAELRPAEGHFLALAALGGAPGALMLDARAIGPDELSGMLQ